MTIEDAVNDALPIAQSGEKYRALRLIEILLDVDDDIDICAYRAYHLRQQRDGKISIDEMLNDHAEAITRHAGFTPCHSYAA